MLLIINVHIQALMCVILTLGFCLVLINNLGSPHAEVTYYRDVNTNNEIGH